MKRIVTILLLLIMTVQSAGLYYYASTTQNRMVQDIEENNDNGSKEKKKEFEVCVSDFLLIAPVLLKRIQLKASEFIMISSPVVDNLAPPPDWAFAY